MGKNKVFKFSQQNISTFASEKSALADTEQYAVIAKLLYGGKESVNIRKRILLLAVATDMYLGKAQVFVDDRFVLITSIYGHEIWVRAIAAQVGINQLVSAI
ncbi:hypothetical protein C1856_07995 [Eggerthella lenta]|nr:hypothetical protein C1856_07995 [Eggerthella lenta]